MLMKEDEQEGLKSIKSAMKKSGNTRKIQKS